MKDLPPPLKTVTYQEMVRALFSHLSYLLLMTSVLDLRRFKYLNVYLLSPSILVSIYFDLFQLLLIPFWSKDP